MTYELADRLRDIADEAFGPFPVQSPDENLSAIERGISEQCRRLVELERPVPMLLWCPECGGRHIDEGDFDTKPHHTHACQHCGHVWRPAIVPTRGVQFLPGFKNGAADEEWLTRDRDDARRHLAQALALVNEQMQMINRLLSALLAAAFAWWLL